MATYNVMNEGSAPAETAGSATVSTEPAPSYASPAYGGAPDSNPYSGEPQYYGNADSSPIATILPKIGLVGVALTIIGIIIEYSGLAALVHATGQAVSIGSLDTLFLLIPVVFVLMSTFRGDKIPHREVLNFLTFIDAVAAAVWSFFVFIVYAQTSADSGVAAVGAAAAGCFFNFIGEAVMAFAVCIAM